MQWVDREYLEKQLKAFAKKIKEKFYTKDEVDDKIDGISVDVNYNDDGVGVTLGGINEGDVFVETPIQDVMHKLLHPYVRPIVSFSISPSKTLYNAVTETVSKITMSTTVTKKSDYIKSIKFYVGNDLVHEVTDDVTKGGSFSYVYEPTTPINSNTTFKVVVNDGINDVQGSVSISFVGASYYGIVAPTIDGTNITDTIIKGLNTNLKSSRGFTYNNINMNYSKILYAYPKSFGNLSSIKDANNISYTNSYTRTEVTVDGIVYNVYIINDASTVNNFTQIYA